MFMHSQLPTRQVDAIVTITLFCDEEQRPSYTLTVDGDLPQGRALRRAFNAVAGSLARLTNGQPYPNPKL
jgi:hypothetical protein